jgi:hypothetical protein
MAYTPSITSANLPGGLQPSAFSSVGGSYANETVLSSIFDYDPFSILQAVHDRHDHFPMFRQMLRMQQAERGVSAPTTGHYERDWRVNLVPMGSIITAGSSGGDAQIMEMASGTMFDNGATVSGSATNVRASNIRIGDVIQAPSGARARVMAKNTTTNPHRITLRPLASGTVMQTAFPASTTYAIFDNMWAEGSGLPEGIVPRLIKYTNTFQIVKAGGASTGTDLTNQLFAQFQPGSDGNVYMVMKDDEMYRYERYMCYALLFGTQVTNTALIEANSDLGHDVDIKGTEGLIPFAETYGHDLTYTAGAYSLDNIDAMGTIFVQERVGTQDIICYQGYAVFQEMENAFSNQITNDQAVFLTKSLGGAAGVPSDMMQPFEDANFSYYVGFKAVRKSGFNFYFRLLHEFSEYVGAGAPGYDYPQYNIVTPLGNTTNRNNGQRTPYISYEFKDFNGYRRLDRVGAFGGVGVAGPGGIGAVPVNEKDLGRFGILSEIAGHFACANKMIVQVPA